MLGEPEVADEEFEAARIDRCKGKDEQLMRRSRGENGERSSVKATMQRARERVRRRRVIDRYDVRSVVMRQLTHKCESTRPVKTVRQAQQSHDSQKIFLLLPLALSSSPSSHRQENFEKTAFTVLPFFLASLAFFSPVLPILPQAFVLLISLPPSQTDR